MIYQHNLPTQRSILQEYKHYQNTWCTSCLLYILSHVIRILTFCHNSKGKIPLLYMTSTKLFTSQPLSYAFIPSVAVTSHRYLSNISTFEFHPREVTTSFLIYLKFLLTKSIRSNTIFVFSNIM